MTFRKALEDKYRERPIYDSDPAATFADLQTMLDERYSFGAPNDLRDIEIALTACHDYRFAADLFLGDGFRTAAETLLLTGWARLCEMQAKSKVRIYKAALAMHLCLVYWSLQDRGAAFRWALLTQIEDLLGRHTEGGGAGRQLLQTVLGMRRGALDGLRDASEQNLSLLTNQHDGDWSADVAFAEDVVVKMVLSDPEWTHLFALPTTVFEYPLNVSYFNAVKLRADTASTNDEKGKVYEHLASYLSTLVPGWLPRSNLLDTKLAFETDIVIRNLAQASNLASDLLGRYILVECKNWASRVGVRDIGYFLYRIKLTHATFGIMFSKMGISGKDQENASYELIRKAFHEDGIVCVVIDQGDIEHLASGEVSYWALLLRKMETARFGKDRQQLR